MKIRIRMPKRSAAVGCVMAMVVAGAAATSTVFAPTASATVATAPAPVAQDGSNHVTSDVLPTAQIDGVAWSQAIAGNTVYVGGSFANARPAGSAPGLNQVPRSNVMSYGLTTGVMTSWAPVVNGQVLAVAVSPDRSRVYIGGQFTTIDGVTHNRVAAFDAATGAVVSSFAPKTDASVNALAVTNSTVYVGGDFSTANGQPRTRVAAFSAADGSLLGWAPSADATVSAMVLTPDGSKVIVGGHFLNVNGVSQVGLAAFSSADGSLQPWAVDKIVQDAGAPAGITSLTTDGTSILGTGYVFGGPKTTGNLEGTFSADPGTGAINWIEDCHGDTYSAFSTGSVVYSTGHTHFCGTVGAFPETTPSRTFHRALSWTANATGALGHNVIAPYVDWGGNPSPSQYNWYPDLDTGTYTGQTQAGWTVTGNSQYVLLGGEFPKVNGIAQQGLVRFAVPGAAPLASNKGGPRLTAAAFVPRLLPLSTTSVRVSFGANWDRDDTTLSYRVFRDGNTATPVYATALTAPFWNLPTISFVDTGLTPGQTYNYKVYANDPAGNTDRGNNVTVTMPTAAPSRGYAAQVLGDGASHFWRLDDTSGSTGKDYAGTDDLIEGAGVTQGAVGAIGADSDTAASFNGATTGSAYGATFVPPPNTFTLEAWVKTTSTSGGKIIGLGNAKTGSSSSSDRQLYLDNAGHVVFGVYNATAYTLTSANTVNNGAWHQIVAELSAAGMALYVDGARAGTNGATTIGEPVWGYWRIGGDNLSGWPAAPKNNYLNGAIDDVAVYPTALSVQQIGQHYTLSGRTVPTPGVPADAYGQAVAADNPDLYWRLDDASGPTATDASAYNAAGSYSGGETFRTPSAVTTSGTGVTFNGSNGTIGSNSSYVNPTTYSEEAWFNTTATGGGKIIGFGNAKSGNSSTYDRHVYMLTTGQLVFGAYTGSRVTITSPGSYNNGLWHQVVATQAGDGMRLYVDGQLVGTDPNAVAQNYSGYWRVGGDSSWAANNYFNGAIDEAAVWLAELSPARVLAHYNASSTAPNTPPTAVFTPTCTYLGCSFDATASADPDGTVTGYAWDFGDSSTGTGVNPSHAYAAGGTYTVTLMVTDNRGATGTVSHPVTVASNQAPTAAFTPTCNQLACTFDGTASADPDGTVTGYAWDFGDGTTASGATTSHSFAVAGTYTVALTVTDNAGAGGSTTQSLTVAGVPVFATDTFNRVVTGGWGSADLGGAWTTTGGTTNFGIAGGVGHLTLATASAGPTAYLNGLSLGDSNSVVDATLNAATTGTSSSANYLYLAARHTGASSTTSEYRLRLKVLTTSAMQLSLTKVVSNTETLLSTVNLTGLTFTPGQFVRLRLQVSGTSSVLLQAKAWVAGATEPASWQTSSTDSSSPLGAGSVGLRSYLSSSATNAPVEADFANFSVGGAVG